jgi:hypothetical protein
MKSKYPGALARPILRPRNAPANYVGDQRKDRLHALFDFFKIDQRDPDKWALLAAELAIRHVPGMSVSRKVGRPSRWDNQAMRELVETVEQLKKAKKMRASDAIRLAQKNDPRLKGVRGLQRRYYEAKKELALLDKRAAEWEKLFPGLEDILLGRKKNV